MIECQFLGHACLRFAGGRGALICDPWWTTVPIYGNTAVKYPFFPREQTGTALDVSHIYISHHHEDHFHVPTLDLYSRTTTMLIPAFEYAAHSRGASMRRTLEKMGFTNVIALDSWQTIEIDLGEPLSLTLIPSAKSRWHDWENSGLILQSADWTALNFNDNLVDAELLGDIQARVGRPDALFIQGFPSTEFPGSFDFSVAEKIHIGRQKRGNVDQADMAIRKLRPRCAVPIACDIAWHRRQDIYRNYSDKPTPSGFAGILERRGLLAETLLLDLAPGDFIDIAALSVKRLYGVLNYAGFRRRLKKKMLRFGDLVDAYDGYSELDGFDALALSSLLADLRAYFPRTFPVEATVRIDFVIVRKDFAPCARISFSVRGRDLTIDLDSGGGIECDQEIIVPGSIWRESLGGYVLRRDLFNLCLNRQLKPFTQSVAALRYFITYYFDFGDISPWARISGRNPRGHVLEQMRAWRDGLAPSFSAQDLRDEYCQGAVALPPAVTEASEIER